MKFSVKQIFTVLISMLLTLALLFVGQRVYRATAVETPLVSNLSRVAGVSQARLEGNSVVVRIKPGADLMTVYRDVAAQAKATTGHAPAKIDIVSHADVTLAQLQKDVPFIIAQGEATGQFMAMKTSIVAMARQHQAGVTVELGAHHLYLTFSHHHRVLYDVVPITIGGNGRG